MGYNIIEHLPAVYVFEQHIPVIVCSNDISQTADVRVIEEGDYGGFSCCADFLGLVCSFLVGTALVIVVG